MKPRPRPTATLFGELEHEAKLWTATLRSSVDRTPWTAVALAAAAGYVLGGGLTPRMTAKLLAAAGRSAVAGALAARVAPLLLTKEDGAAT